jgi:hypothetical protein
MHISSGAVPASHTAGANAAGGDMVIYIYIYIYIYYICIYIYLQALFPLDPPLARMLLAAVLHTCADDMVTVCERAFSHSLSLSLSLTLSLSLSLTHTHTHHTLSLSRHLETSSKKTQNEDPSLSLLAAFQHTCADDMLTVCVRPCAPVRVRVRVCVDRNAECTLLWHSETPCVCVCMCV